MIVGEKSSFWKLEDLQNSFLYNQLEHAFGKTCSSWFSTRVSPTGASTNYVRQRTKKTAKFGWRIAEGVLKSSFDKLGTKTMVFKIGL